MPAIRIYDTEKHGLTVDLTDLLRLLRPLSLQADWAVSTDKSSTPGHQWFEATGDGGEELERLATTNTRLTGPDLATLAKQIRQVIWGEFTGFLAKADRPWVIIQAVDGTFLEIETDDETVLTKIRAAYKDIRVGEDPVDSWPLPEAMK